jgi:hypothetical protein
MMQVIQANILTVVNIVMTIRMIDLSNILISRVGSVLIVNSSKKKDIILSNNQAQTDFMIIAKDTTKEIVSFISAFVPSVRDKLHSIEIIPRKDMREVSEHSAMQRIPVTPLLS